MMRISLKPCARLFAGLLIPIVFSVFPNCQAQNIDLYQYQDLSHVYYAKKKDSLKKNWVCPPIYKEKETQKKYKEIWDERTSMITGSIERRCYVYEKIVYAYLEGIISEIAHANPKLIPNKPLLLVDRSSTVNAYSVGGNIIIVNLGLVTFARTREDIALVIAHELSHNVMDHAGNSMKQKAEWLTSDEYKKTLNSILDSKTERYTKLMKVFEGYSFNRSRHSRYHEHDADSLAVVMLKASKIAVDPSFLLRLDSADIQYKQPLKQSVKAYLAGYKQPFEDWWAQKKSKGLSTRAYNFNDTTGIEDSLKTHPDCQQRFVRTEKYMDKGASLKPIPKDVQEKATRMLIWNLFDDNMLTTCMYRVLLEKDKGNTSEWYDFMLHNIFAGLVYSDKQLNRFNAVGVMKKEYISASYYELQNTLEQMPKEAMEQQYKAMHNNSFWSKMSSDAMALKKLMNDVITAPDDKNKAVAAKSFTASYSTSMYNEFTDRILKK